MDNDAFSEAIHQLVKAAVVFLDTDAAYGPGDVRTGETKRALAAAIAALCATEVEIPALRVIRGGVDDDGA